MKVEAIRAISYLNLKEIVFRFEYNSSDLVAIININVQLYMLKITVSCRFNSERNLELNDPGNRIPELLQIDSSLIRIRIFAKATTSSRTVYQRTQMSLQTQLGQQQQERRIKEGIGARANSFTTV